MDGRFVDGARIKQFMKSEDIQSELFAARLEMCMTDFRRLVKKGVLPKKRRQFRLQKIAQIMGIGIDEILIPFEAKRAG